MASHDNYFFIKDQKLSLYTDDKFKHADIADMIVNTIIKYDAPYNIALVGSWGIGKSSLLEIVKNELETNLKKNKDYNIIEVNAWKYEKEALRKILLIKMSEEAGCTIKSDREDFKDLYEITATSKNKEDDLSIGKKLINIVLSFLTKILETLFLLGTTFFFITLYYLNKYNPQQEVVNIIVSAAINSIFAILSKNKKSGINIDTNITFPPKGTEEYQKIFDIKLEEKKNQNKQYKFICILDDIDRLPVNKVVEALDAIKSFVDNDNCIFIVPFDQEIITKSINRGKNQDNKNDYSVVESELLLNKLFQFRFEIPPIDEMNMVQYAKDLCVIEINETITLCDNETQKGFFLDTIIPILVSPFVKTPREVKKNINTFLTNLYLFIKRKERTQLEISETSLLKLAKISVLQANYYEVYKSLDQIDNIDDKIIKLQDDKISDKDISEKSKKILENIKIIMEKNNTWDGLINYLAYTLHINLKYVHNYIYYNQNDISVDIGNEKYKLIKTYGASAQVDKLDNAIQQDKNFYKTIKSLYDMEHKYLYKVRYYLTLFKCINSLKEKDTVKEASNFLSYEIKNVVKDYIKFTELQEDKTDMLDFDFKDLITVYKYSNNKENFKYLFEYKKQYFNENVEFIKSCIENIEKFSEAEENDGSNEILSKHISNYVIETMNDMVSNDEEVPIYEDSLFDVGNSHDCNESQFNNLTILINLYKYIDEKKYAEIVDIIIKVNEINSEPYFGINDNIITVCKELLVNKIKYTNTIDNLIDNIIKAFTDYNIIDTISQAICDRKDEISMQQSNNIIKRIIKLDVEKCTNKTISIMESLNYSIENYIDDFDDYFVGVNNDYYIYDILVKNKQYIYQLTKIVEEINLEVVDNKDDNIQSDYKNDLPKIFLHYNSDQKQDIITNVLNKFENINSEDEYKWLEDVIDICLKTDEVTITNENQDVKLFSNILSETLSQLLNNISVNTNLYLFKIIDFLLPKLSDIDIKNIENTISNLEILISKGNKALYLSIVFKLSKYFDESCIDIVSNKMVTEYLNQKENIEDIDFKKVITIIEYIGADKIDSSVYLECHIATIINNLHNIENINDDIIEFIANAINEQNNCLFDVLNEVLSAKANVAFINSILIKMYGDGVVKNVLFELKSENIVTLMNILKLYNLHLKDKATGTKSKIIEVLEKIKDNVDEDFDSNDFIFEVQKLQPIYKQPKQLNDIKEILNDIANNCKEIEDKQRIQELADGFKSKKTKRSKATTNN